MMKKLMVLGLVALMMVGVAGVANAYYVTVAVSNGSTSATVNFSDWIDPADGDGVMPPAVASSYVQMGTLDAANGATYQGTVTDPAHASTTPWDFYVWNVGTSAAVTLTAYLQDNDGNNWGGNPCGMTWKVTDVTAGQAVKTFTFTGVNAANAANDPSIYSVSTALTAGTANTPEHYQIQEVTVPEPGSLVALFSGIVGLVGYGIRRRK